MNSKTLSAGDTIDSRCTRCRAIMNHTIVAMVGDRVARVLCNTCGSTHNHKEEKPARTAADGQAVRKAAAPPRKPRRDPGAADREEWEGLRPAMEGVQATPYAMDGKYKVNHLIDHPVFGLGVVKSVVPGKIEVLFREGKKLLRCQ